MHETRSQVSLFLNVSRRSFEVYLGYTDSNKTPKEMQQAAEETNEYPTDLYRFMDMASLVLISTLRPQSFHKDSTHSPGPDEFSMNSSIGNVSLFNPWNPSLPISSKCTAANDGTIWTTVTFDYKDEELLELTSIQVGSGMWLSVLLFNIL
jgi:hypothetical protein